MADYNVPAGDTATVLTLSGTNTFEGNSSNPYGSGGGTLLVILSADGATITATGGTLAFEASADGNGATITLNNATLNLVNGHDFNKGVINFGSGQSSVILNSKIDGSNNLEGIKFTGLSNGDIITTNSAAPITGLSYNSANGTLSFTQNGTTYTASVTLATGVAADFSVQTLNGVQTIVQGSLPVVCFVSGARIRTTRGDAKVEDLQVGDLVVTSSGEERSIIWIGRRTMTQPGRSAWPVRVQAGAFADGVPVRDLLLSPGHAVCVDVLGEVFIPVGQLINGVSIAPQEVDEVTYWHVELESHDVLLAEGLGCESYMDAGNRAFFGREHGRLGQVDPARIAESLTRYARPFVAGGVVAAAVRQRAAARLVALGWTRSKDPDLHLLVDGKRYEGEIDGDLARFIFPAAAREARIVSRAFIPAADSQSDDVRALGLQIRGVQVSDGLRVQLTVPLDHAALGEGFFSLEREGDRTWRWTAGEAILSSDLWADCRGQVILRLAFEPLDVWRFLSPANAGPGSMPSSPPDVLHIRDSA